MHICSGIPQTHCSNTAKLQEHRSAENEAELVFCESSVGVGNASNTWQRWAILKSFWVLSDPAYPVLCCCQHSIMVRLEQGTYNTSNTSLYIPELKHQLLLQFLAQFHKCSTMLKIRRPPQHEEWRQIWPTALKTFSFSGQTFKWGRGTAKWMWTGQIPVFHCKVSNQKVSTAFQLLTVQKLSPADNRTQESP